MKISTTICMTGLAAIAMLMPSAAHADGFANPGFETAGTPPEAASWPGAGTDGYTRTDADAFSGEWSALLGPTSVSGSAVLLQNSVADGGQAPIVVGSNPLLSFQAKGAAGATGVAIYALRYLDADGNILADSTLQNFGGAISPFSWAEITYDLGPVPVGASSAFIEIVLQGGGEPNGQILIDDVKLFVKGDANGDGVVNNFDIASFGLALFNRPMYLLQFPDADPDCVLDMNGDGVLNNFDISGFGTALGF